MTKATVEAGICGFTTVITISSEDRQHAVIQLETGCPNLKPLEGHPIEVDAFVECFSKIGQSSVFELVRAHGKHPGCPVASGIIKGIEVACGLALPKDATIHIENSED